MRVITCGKLLRFSGIHDKFQGKKLTRIQVNESIITDGGDQVSVPLTSDKFFLFKVRYILFMIFFPHRQSKNIFLCEKAT